MPNKLKIYQFAVPKYVLYNLIYLYQCYFVIYSFDFSTEMLALFDAHYDLIDRTWYSDESTFNLNGVVNRHNSYYWSDENPNYQIEQQQKSIGLTVWAAISS